jgi:hypothetical protein
MTMTTEIPELPQKNWRREAASSLIEEIENPDENDEEGQQHDGLNGVDSLGDDMFFRNSWKEAFEGAEQQNIH